MKFEKVLNTIPEFLVPHMGRTLKVIDLYISAALRSAGYELTKNQLILLKCISLGVQSQSELSVITNRNKSSLTRLVQGMEKKGLIIKSSSTKDKRHHILSLTLSGEALYEKAMPVVEDCFKKLELGLLPEEIEQMKNILIRMRANVNEELNQIEHA